MATSIKSPSTTWDVVCGYTLQKHAIYINLLMIKATIICMLLVIMYINCTWVKGKINTRDLTIKNKHLFRKLVTTESFKEIINYFHYHSAQVMWIQKSICRTPTTQKTALGNKTLKVQQMCLALLCSFGYNLWNFISPKFICSSHKYCCMMGRRAKKQLKWEDLTTLPTIYCQNLFSSNIVLYT